MRCCFFVDDKVSAHGGENARFKVGGLEVGVWFEVELDVFSVFSGDAPEEGFGEEVEELGGGFVIVLAVALVLCLGPGVGEIGLDAGGLGFLDVGGDGAAGRPESCV